MFGSKRAVQNASPSQGGRRLQGRSKRSQQHIARIAQYIAEEGQASAAQLSALLALDAGTISRYLRHMCDSGVIHLAQRHCTEPGRQRPALYASGEANDDSERWAELPPQVRHSRFWPLGQAVRDPLVAALFGPGR